MRNGKAMVSIPSDEGEDIYEGWVIYDGRAVTLDGHDLRRDSRERITWPIGRIGQIDWYGDEPA